MIRIMLILSRIKRPRPWFDSAPGHQESQWPTCWAIFIRSAQWRLDLAPSVFSQIPQIQSFNQDSAALVLTGILGSRRVL